MLRIGRINSKFKWTLYYYQICISSRQQLHIIACHVGPLGVLSECLQVFSRPLGFIKGEVSQTDDNLRSELDT